MLPTTWRPRRRRFAGRAFRTLSLLVSLTACSSCAGHREAAPTLARADARPLAVLAQKIAGEGPCAQRRDIQLLQQQAIGLVNSRRVPAALQEQLVGGVNALAAQTPVCVPSVPVATTPPPAPRPHPGPPHPKPHGHDHHHHGHGEHD